MQSRWDESDAARAVERWAPRFGETLALRTYSARLLGADPALVLHGGGNTSAKGSARTLFGDEVEVLFIKGSGGDLATIEPPGHPAVQLEPLRRLRARDELADEAMVAAQRLALLDPAAPNPSIECLLHAFLPARFVDHTHADAVLALADQPDAETICRDVYGHGLVFVPYVKPGFELAKACAHAFDAARGRAEVIVLQQHGVFTFGPDARVAYENMIEAVTRAEAYVAGKRGRPSVLPGAAIDGPLRRRVAPILRGVLARAGGPNVLAFDESDRARAFAASASTARLSQVGPATPDHVIRTRPWPMLAPRLDAAHGDDALRAALTEAAERFATRYAAYVDAGIAARGERRRLDGAPRVVLLPGLGVVGVGRTLADARIAREIYAHTIEVISAATAIGEYQPVAPLDLFDLEYWSLEQAKLGKQVVRALDGKVAFVTGAASGIGRACVDALLADGAHVVLSDRDPRALSAALEPLERAFGTRVAAVACDVGDDEVVGAAIDACVNRYGGLDVLVSNAGTAPQGLLHEAGGADALEASLSVNLLGHQHVAAAAARVMIAQGTGGAMIFNASKAAFAPGPAFGPYAVAKAATVALMRQYAIDLGAHGVRCNAVNADRVRTGLFGGGVLEARAKARGVEPDAYFRSNLLGREVTAADVASAIGWLASAASTTGCVVTVDGGNAAAFPR